MPLQKMSHKNRAIGSWNAAIKLYAVVLRNRNANKVTKEGIQELIFLAQMIYNESQEYWKDRHTGRGVPSLRELGLFEEENKEDE